MWLFLSFLHTHMASGYVSMLIFFCGTMAIPLIVLSLQAGREHVEKYERENRRIIPSALHMRRRAFIWCFWFLFTGLRHTCHFGPNGPTESGDAIPVFGNALSGIEPYKAGATS
ncbi:hypothetical protein BD410DRAFT_139250 [Rickenella mellea]|uniref:Uncharacterized protein n=1 Tax=Rickenella mellea TaxID=50990 RepID=A0A4Y7PJB1_9AGAM|nr:hypothetical protein BD410DRAFT_139250 [Rickenella mellea]